MRQLNRVHRVTISWLHEGVSNSSDVNLLFTESMKMRAVIWTKMFSNPVKFEYVLSLMGVMKERDIELAGQGKGQIIAI